MVLETSVDHLMRLLAREYFIERYEILNLTKRNPSFHKLYYINQIYETERERQTDRERERDRERIYIGVCACVRARTMNSLFMFT
jgi:hypothetical protein